MKPHNPGMSEQAWKNLHRVVARLKMKYRHKIKKGAV